MKFMTFPRSLLLACFLLPACGDDKGDDTTATDGTSNATPATPATPASESDTMDVPTTGGTDTTVDPSGDPSGDPTTMDPTAGGGDVCQEQCAADGDCTLMGMDSGFKCVDKLCQLLCTDNNSCVVQYSGFAFAMDCAAQADCPGQVCIDIGGGVGKCATPPSDFFMCNTIPGFADTMFPSIEGDMDLTVCANSNYECLDGQCKDPCAADSDCSLIPGLSKCDTGSGDCVCADDAGCLAANPMTPVCQASGFCGCADDSNCSGDTPKCTADGFCGCAEDANCTASGFGDVCNANGVCGCSDASACTGTKSFDGTAFACEGA